MTELEIYNQALTLLGLRTLTATSDATVEADLCRLHYPAIRDSLLATGWYDFANQNVILENDANTTQMTMQMQDIQWASNIVTTSFTTPGGSEWGFAHAYALPAEILSVNFLYVGPEYDPNNRTDEWKLWEDSLLANDNPVYLNAAMRVVDPTFYGPLLGESLVYSLAHRLVRPLTKDRALAMDIASKMNECNARSAGKGWGHRVKRDQRSSTLVRRRYAGRGGRL